MWFCRFTWEIYIYIYHLDYWPNRHAISAKSGVWRHKTLIFGPPSELFQNFTDCFVSKGGHVPYFSGTSLASTVTFGEWMCQNPPQKNPDAKCKWYIYISFAGNDIYIYHLREGRNDVSVVFLEGALEVPSV